MGVLTNNNEIAPSVQKKVDNAYLSKVATSKMKEVIEFDGRTMTVGQAIVERQANIAMFAQSNSDSTASAKFLFDRVLGKAGVMKSQDATQIPKIIFALDNASLDDMAKAANEYKEEPEEDPRVLIKLDDGEEMLV